MRGALIFLNKANYLFKCILCYKVCILIVIYLDTLFVIPSHYNEKKNIDLFLYEENVYWHWLCMYMCVCVHVTDLSSKTSVYVHNDKLMSVTWSLARLSLSRI